MSIDADLAAALQAGKTDAALKSLTAAWRSTPALAWTRDGKLLRAEPVK